MTWPNPPDWVIYAGAVACLLLGPPLLYWSLWRDRPRGRLRCPRCWYDLGAVSPAADTGTFAPVTCPECGRVARAPRDLRRTRRRWAVAVAAMLLVAGAPVLAAWPAIRARGFWASVPTTVLLGVESLLGTGTWPALSEARQQRLYRLDHSQWQWRLLLERAGGGLADLRTRWPEGVP
ncbi:MAG: hypothetical protein JNJ48_07970, partial [Phycisphaerae bacterium]|nr:hypothetical protein [Phycisphaerae bacterium]